MYRSLVVLLWLAMSVATAAMTAQVRDDHLARFLEARRVLSPLCLYTFDRFRPAITATLPTATVTDALNDTSQDLDRVTIPPTFQEHVGRTCPFGDLQFDPELVTSLDDGNTTRQPGVHLAESPDNNSKRPQIASNEVTPAKAFYEWAAGGFTVEFSYRRRVALNQTMTLFSIGSLFGDCADPGFRVDLNGKHNLMLMYFFPTVTEDHDVMCSERRLYATRTQLCIPPSYRENVDDNPIVHVMLTVQVGKSSSSFFIKYVDPVTMETHECTTTDTTDHPDRSIEVDYIPGTYRLLIGNNPNNVTAPLRHAVIAPARSYRDPALEALTPEKRLRALIEQKLDSITGPRLPEAYRMFGGHGFSLSFLGIKFPPINEDTPFTIIREAIDSFKKNNLDKIVDFIIKSLKRGNRDNYEALPPGDAGEGEAASDGQSVDDKVPTSRPNIYPDANGSTFDLFHFAIYAAPVQTRYVQDMIWPTMMTPFRPFMTFNQTFHVLEDEERLFELLQLHSVYDDIQLEIAELPKRGKLLLYPSKTALTPDNLDSFRELPMEHQQKIYFVSNLHENNKNIPKESVWGDLGRQFLPYAIFRYRVWKTTTGRRVNESLVATIEIFVDPVDNPPTPLADLMHIDVRRNGPTYVDLVGNDEDGIDGLEKKKFFDARRSLGILGNLPSSLPGGLPGGLPGSLTEGLFGSLSDSSETKVPANAEPQQNVRIVQFPRYGRLYDRNMVNTTGRMQATTNGDPSELEPYRIHREWIANRTFSTSLVYIFNREVMDSVAEDVLQYQLRVGDSASFSKIATVQFRLPAVVAAAGTMANETNSVAVVQLDEESSVTIELLVFEPLTAQLDSKITFRVVQLPLHGRLYQYVDDPTSSGRKTNTSVIGPVIQDHGEVVSDDQGRVVYVPDPNYFNSVPGDNDGRYDALEQPLDSLQFQVVDIQDHLLNASVEGEGLHETRFLPRSIELQVINVPDKLVVLPPTVFSVNASWGEAVRIPVIFEDPDGFSGHYRVQLEAKDDISQFELGHVITDDDMLKFCPRERPCHLIRSANASYVSTDDGDEAEVGEWQLKHKIKSSTWRGSDIDVQGSKKALQSALAGLVFRDWSRWTWDGNHTAQFKVTIERVNSSFDAKAEMKFYIDYPPGYSDDEEDDSLLGALSNLGDMITMGLWIAFFAFVLSSASCCSMSFCCCCARARAQKRLEFDDARRRYVAQVVQNDVEYSSLLMAMADVFLEPELQVSVLLLRSCRSSPTTTTQRSPCQVLCVKSLLPLLETENQGLRFVLRVLSLELQENKVCDTAHILQYPSTASLAIVEFCRLKGEMWLKLVWVSLASGELTESSEAAASLMNALESHLDSLPAELVVLFRTCAATVTSSWNSLDLADSTHVFFFNHFLGPKLWFTRRDETTGKRLSQAQRLAVRGALSTIASYSRYTGDLTFEVDNGVMCRYKRLLQKIVTCPTLPNSFDSNSHASVDCELMASCLMNLHSILDSTLPALECEEKMYETIHGASEPKDEYVTDDVADSSVAKVKRVLRALNFPLANAGALLASCEIKLASDPLLWNGFSRSEWESRFAASLHNDSRATPPFASHLHSRQRRAPLPPPPRELRHAQSLLAVEIHTTTESATMTAAFESTRSCGATTTDGVDHAYRQALSMEFEF